MSEAAEKSLKKTSPKKKKIVAGSVVAVVAVVVIVAVILFVALGDKLLSHTEELNVGFSKDEVLAVMGEPYAGKDTDTWEYYSKNYKEGDEEFEYVCIVFDGNDKAVQISYNAKGKDTNKELNSVTLNAFKNSGDKNQAVTTLYVSIPTPADNPDAWEANEYDLVYTTDYKDGSFSKVLVKEAFSSESTETIVLTWNDGFGIGSQAKVRFEYPKTVTYVLNGGINDSSNIEGFTDEYLESLENGFELKAPAINACEFADVKANADGSISCVVIEKGFEGWYTDSSFKNKVTSIKAGSGNVTLYAKWGAEINRTTYTDEEYVRGADTVLFGVYPQSLKADNVTISGGADANGYYTGSDGNLYVKVTATPQDSDYKFKNGTKISKGNSYYFMLEPVEWRVLGTDGDNAILLADKILAGHSYDKDGVKWKDSDVREWLNSDFMNDMFNSAQQALIVNTQVSNDLASAPVDTSGKNGNIDDNDNVTEDMVWLLSYAEVQNEAYGFVGELAMGDSVDDGIDPLRAKSVIDYARATGAFMKTEKKNYGNGCWWLRSPYYDSAKVMDVRSDGYVDVYDEGTFVSGIVPAVTLNLG